MKGFRLAVLGLMLSCVCSGHADVTSSQQNLPTIDLKFVEGLMLPLPKSLRTLVDYTNLVKLAETSRAMSVEFARTGALSYEDRETFLEDVRLALLTTREPLMRLGDLDFGNALPQTKASSDGPEARRREFKRQRERAHEAVHMLMVGISQVVFSAGISERTSRSLSLLMAGYANELSGHGSNATRERRSDLDRALNLFLMVSTKSFGVKPPKTCREYLGRVRKANAYLKQIR